MNLIAIAAKQCSSINVKFCIIKKYYWVTVFNGKICFLINRADNHTEKADPLLLPTK